MYPIIQEYYEKVVLFGQDKDKMEIEDQIMFGYKNSYEIFEKMKTFFLPHYELWSSINDVYTTTKGWNNQKMREMKAEDVENLINFNFRRIRKVTSSLEDSWTVSVIK